MNHKELLQQIEDTEYFPWMQDALRSVVELHEPMDNYAGNVCGYCFSLNYEPTGLEMDYELYSYPCTTIKIIEKELA